MNVGMKEMNRTSMKKNTSIEKIIILVSLSLLFLWIILSAIFNVEAAIGNSFASSHIAILAGPALILSLMVFSTIALRINGWIYRILFVLVLTSLVTCLSWIAIIFLTILMHGL